MKITLISIQKFIAVKDLFLRPAKKVLLIAGSNESGKSTTLDAIGLALTGDLPRVDKKKDAKALVSQSADAKQFAQITVEVDGEEHTTLIRQSGTIKAKGGDLQSKHPALSYVLQAQRFAALGEKERKTFLFGLLGVGIKLADLKERLLKKGHSPELVNNRILPMLRLGFDEAHKDAQDQLRDLKRDWEKITGEKYGPDKAKDWAIAVDSTTLGVLDEQESLLKDESLAVGLNVDRLNKRIGEARTSNMVREQTVLLLEREESTVKLVESTRRVKDELTSKIDELASRSNATHGATSCVCPCCNEQVWFKNGSLFKPDTDAQEATDDDIIQLNNAKHLLAQTEEVLTEAEKTLAAINQAKEKELPAAVDVGSLDQEVAEHKVKQQEILDRLSEVVTQKAKIQVAEAKNKSATEMHAQAVAMQKVVDDLAPDGIPAELLSEALKPINERLAKSGEATGWGAVTINQDMSISANGFPYGLMSVSRKWRTDAMIAEAISHQAKLGLLFLDGFDVLQLSCRGKLFRWLNDLAESGEITSAIVCGTLKGPLGEVMDNRFPNVQSEWIEAGICGHRPVEVNDVKSAQKVDAEDETFVF